MQQLISIYVISLVLLCLSYDVSAVPWNKQENKETSYEGTFDAFLKKFLFLLSGGREKPVQEICKIFQKHLRRMGHHRYTRWLARQFKNLSTMYIEMIRWELNEYREDLEHKSDTIIAFFKAINEAFTRQQMTKFDDYLYDMENYLRGDKRVIDKETKNLLNDVILKSIYNMSKRDKADIEKRLKKVIKEHDRDSDIESL